MYSHYLICVSLEVFPGGSAGKESTWNVEDLGSILDWKDPLEKVYPLQYSVLENSMDYSPWGQKESDMTEQLSLSEPSMGFPESSVDKESTCNTGDPSSIPGLGRSAGEGISYPPQYSSLENFMDCIVHGVAKSETWLSDFHFRTFCRTWYKILYVYVLK